MQKIKTLAFRYPLITSILVMLAAAGLTEIHIENTLTPSLGFQNASYLTGVIEQGGVSILIFMLLAQFGMLAEAGFTRPKAWKQIWLIWPVILLSLINGDPSIVEGGPAIDFARPLTIILFVLLYFSTGFFEEILFRGFILRFMLKKWGRTRRGIYLAVVLSSVIFGLLHLLNLFMGRRTLLATGSQILYGAFFGVFFTACFLRNRSIWPVIFGHFLFDLCGNLDAISVGGRFGQIKEASPEGALIAILFTLPLLLYGLFILRKVEPEQSNLIIESSIQLTNLA